MLKITIVLILSISLIGCLGSMPMRYQQNNPLLTTPNQGGGTGYVDTQAIIDARLHAQQDYHDGFNNQQLPFFRLEALQGKPKEYQFYYRQEYIRELTRLRRNNINTIAASLVLIGVVVLILVLVREM